MKFWEMYKRERETETERQRERGLGTRQAWLVDCPIIAQIGPADNQ